MRGNDAFKGLPKGFWAHIRSLSQTLGYTARGTGKIKVPTFAEILAGMRQLELEEMRVETGIEVEHILIADAHYTWWECGRSYLCRMIDMLHMGYVDEILFGKEVEDRLPAMVAEWVERTRARQAKAPIVLPDDTPLL